MEQIMQEAMFLRVYTINGRFFVDGYALDALGRNDLVGGSKDQYYEFTIEEIDQMINDYGSVNPYVELTPEFSRISPADLANVYGVTYKLNNDTSDEIIISKSPEIDFDEINSILDEEIISTSPEINFDEINAMFDEEQNSSVNGVEDTTGTSYK